MLGRQKAAEVIRQHGANDPREIARAEGLAIARLDFGDARFREFSIDGVIFLPSAARSEAEERSSVAHALGHHFLHVGGQLWMRKLDSAWSRKRERQAEEFAAWLLIPESESANLIGSTPAEIAELYQTDARLAQIRAAR